MLAAAAVPLLAGAWNPNLWFDECYTVGLLRRPFPEMVRAAAADVHPLLYYLMLRGWAALFGESLVALRLFSALPVLLLALCGGRTVEQEFGRRTGRYFALITLLLPAVMRYGTQLRMYSWAMLFVGVAALAAWRAHRRGKPRDFAALAAFALLAGYTHYFALLAVGVIELLLLLSLRRGRRGLRAFLLAAAAQVILYLPGLVLFLGQAMQVAQGYWITISYPQVLFESLAVFFWDGANTGRFLLRAGLGVLAGAGTLVLALRRRGAARRALLVIGLVLAAALLVSVVRPIYISRYLLPMAGLVSFALARGLAAVKRRELRAAALCVIALLGFGSAVYLRAVEQDPQNGEVERTLRALTGEEDIILSSSLRPSGQLSLMLPDRRQFFYHPEDWNMTYYAAFEPQTRCITSLDEIRQERVCVVDDPGSDLASELTGRGYLRIKRCEVYHPYSGETFVISILEKIEYTNTAIGGTGRVSDIGL